MDATAAALDAGFTRFRPVLMTALAMIIGMLPMAFAPGRRRRAECAARARRHRRPACCDVRHAVLRSHRVQPVALASRLRAEETDRIPTAAVSAP